jgi:TnpA family transposase
MKQVWTADELGECWTLNDDELAFVENRRGAGNRLGIALQLKHYQLYAQFLNGDREVPADVAEYLLNQFGDGTTPLDDYDWTGRSGRRHRQEILQFLNVRDFDDEAETQLRAWLIKEVLPAAPPVSYLADLITDWLLSNRIDRPKSSRLDRLIKSAGREHEDRLFAGIRTQLDSTTCARLNALLVEQEGSTPFSRLRSDIGPVSLASVMKETAKLSELRGLALQKKLLADLKPNLIDNYRQRVARENSWELKRHPDHIRYPLLVFYCLSREAEVIDGLVELLIQVVHRIGARAERKVIKELINDFVKVNGKAGILFRIAEAVYDDPDGTVRDVVFPVASEDTIANLVKEFRSNGPQYQVRVHSKMRASYSSHYRKMLPCILETLDFRSNNTSHRPILEAIDIIKEHRNNRRQYFNVDQVPIKGVVRSKWHDLVVETAPDGAERVNRINYEICVLQTLRERLRCKEIWVVGADRYRNPDEDLPVDFDKRREDYYAKLNLPSNVGEFISDLKSKMTEALTSLNESQPKNPKVRIKHRSGKPHISITPHDALPAPPNLDKLKQELNRRWPATSLLDVLKETDLRISFTQAFSTSGSREVTDADEVQRRLLLTLYGLGTNAGLKRVAAGRHGVSYKELLHIRRRYVDKASMRDAIRRVVNAIMAVRAPDIWVAAMIEGVLHHCTDMEVERQYVDSHGQSEVAFTFCHLLGFSLLPRLKAIGRQKLYLPDAELRANLDNLDAILTRPIDWELIIQQYDEMVKYATALRERTAEPEAILRRFTRSNVKHPTYKALAELGKVIKTMFLCDYLGSEELRREIDDGLNVVERWNGTNDFIFFGKSGEVATNRLEDQEMAALALHLLQVSLVYINTLMLQQVLGESSWRSRMTERDMAALTPLLYVHVNPYGIFELDMSRRLPLDDLALAA